MLTYACENFLLPPLLLILDMLLNTTGYNIYNLYTQSGSLFQSTVDGYFYVVLAYGLVLSLRPYANHIFEFKMPTERQRNLRALVSFVVYLAYQIWMK